MRRIAIFLVMLLTAACGSTVPQAARPSGDGLDVTTGDTEVGSGATASGADTTATSAGSRGTVTVPSTRAGVRVGAAGSTVTVGIRYASNSNSLITSVGFSGVNPGDGRAIAQSVVDDINARGGIAGRRIAPIYYPFDVTASTAPGGGDAEQQKACAAFTEDNKVFAVVSPIVSGEVLQACLAKRGVVFVDENWNYFAGDMTDNYWAPAYPDPLRSVPALVDRLVANGFLDKSAKVGVVYQDLPTRRRLIDKALRPALVRHGLKINDSVAWSAQRADVFAGGPLKFRASGITHVFLLDPGGLETFGWMTQAESQAYRPRYAIDTRNYPYLQAGQSPPNQLANARGIGWVPSADIGVQPPQELTTADRRCLGVVAKSGQNLSDATNVRVALAYCDTLEFLKRAAGDASTALSLATIKAGGEALADRYTPTGTFSTRFGPRRHDGASAARDLAFDSACSCFRYTSPVFSIG